MAYDIAKVFNYKADNTDEGIWASRTAKTCPFRNLKCTKGNVRDPLGVCSIEEGERKAIVCPFRFFEGGDIFRKSADLGFGEGADFTVIREVPFLRTPEGRRVAKFDFVLVQHSGSSVQNFCILESQSVYFSGPEIRNEFRDYMATRRVPAPAEGRRPDYRSSSLKRLMPQLMIKVPWVRQRWGKHFFVAIDSGFYGWMPGLHEQTDLTNSEITWLIYDLREDTGSNLYRLSFVRPSYTLLSDAMTSLTAGRPLTRLEFEAELSRRLRRMGRDPDSSRTGRRSGLPRR
jgi:Fe2+ transport system protein FeoA